MYKTKKLTIISLLLPLFIFLVTCLAQVTPAVANEEANKYYLDAYNLYKLGKLDESLDMLKKVIEIDPDHAEAHFGMGSIYFRQNAFDKSIKEFTKVTRIKPDYVEAYQRLWLAYKKLDMNDKAEEALQTYKRIIEERMQSRGAGTPKVVRPATPQKKERKAEEHGPATKRPEEHVDTHHVQESEHVKTAPHETGAASRRASVVRPPEGKVAHVHVHEGDKEKPADTHKHEHVETAAPSHGEHSSIHEQAVSATHEKPAAQARKHTETTTDHPHGESVTHTGKEPISHETPDVHKDAGHAAEHARTVVESGHAPEKKEPATAVHRTESHVYQSKAPEPATRIHQTEYKPRRDSSSYRHLFKPFEKMGSTLFKLHFIKAIEKWHETYTGKLVKSLIYYVIVVQLWLCAAAFLCLYFRKRKKKV